MFELFKVIAMVVVFLITVSSTLYIYRYFDKRENKSRTEFNKKFYFVPRFITFSLFSWVLCFFSVLYKNNKEFYVGFALWIIFFVLTQIFFSQGKRKEMINHST